MHRKRTFSAILAVGLVVGAIGPSAGSKELGKRKAESAPVTVALGYVRDHHADLGVSRSDLAHLIVTDAYRSAHNGVTHVYLKQELAGLEVTGSAATVNVMLDGTVLSAQDRFIRNVAQRASGYTALDARAAVTAAAAQLRLGRPQDLRVIEQRSDIARSQVLSDGGISLAPIPAHLVYETSGRALRLAWNIEIQTVDEQHWWNLSVDAANGRVLSRVDYIVHDKAEDIAAALKRPRSKSVRAVSGSPDAVADGAKYRVYALPLESPNDGPRTVVTNPADASASPLGWHDANGAPGPEYTTTRGNNVHAYTDYTPGANTALPLMDADGGASLNFDFSLDFALPPPAWKDAAVTNLFYWNNIIHDVFYGYGFDEVSGNFQTFNYTAEGVGNDSVQAEAQDGSGTNNANFGTPAEGSRPRMQMYLWPNTDKNQVIDGDLDAGVIAHEYSHGISNRLTGGPSDVECLRHQEREGEGWSDFLALALVARDGESGEQRRGMGAYVLGEPNRQGDGIRPTPYSTDMSIDPATYDTIKTAAAPHGVGYVWATMLWDMYWDFVEVYGFNPDVYGDWTTGGNNLAIQLVMDGMKMQVCSPGFVDSRDAILAADVALTDGENQCLIWGAFARRGLGEFADQGAVTSKTDGTEDFTLPEICTI